MLSACPCCSSTVSVCWGKQKWGKVAPVAQTQVLSQVSRDMEVGEGDYGWGGRGLCMGEEDWGRGDWVWRGTVRERWVHWGAHGPLLAELLGGARHCLIPGGSVRCIAPNWLTGVCL